MPVTEWREPALVWNGNVSSVGRPRILEIRNDDFIPVFLRGMASTDPASFFQDHQLGKKAGQPHKLFQPLHGCYYLVTASLVCRQLGLPDKTIARADGETVSYVIRRLTNEGEEAWIPSGESGYWLPLHSEDVLWVASGEETFPMHPVKVTSAPETPRSAFTDFIERDIHYGYIPTGNREKYRDTVARTTPAGTTAEQLVHDYFEEVERQASEDGVDFDFRAGMFQQRVYEPWRQLIRRLSNSAAKVASSGPNGVMATDDDELMLYVLLEFGDYLKNNLPTFWEMLQNPNRSDANKATFPAAMVTLYETLIEDLTVQHSVDGDISLRDALFDLEAFFDLVRGEGDEPPDDYDISSTVNESDLSNVINDEVLSALGQETAPMQLPGGENSEMARLVSQQVQPVPTTEPQYHIRAVYIYDEECPPVVSELPSVPFTLAPFFEPDAPARMIRLEAPSIKLKDLRKYSRGVGISMSPELHKLTQCMRGDDQDGVIDSLTGSCEGSGLSFQMVCTFSIQIIFLVAFIVMFMFLIAFNFIFWWLAFLRICLPIPRKT